MNMERQYRLTPLGQRAFSEGRFANSAAITGMVRRLAAGAVTRPALLGGSDQSEPSAVIGPLVQLAAWGAVEELLVDQAGVLRATVVRPNIIASTLPRGHQLWQAQPHIFFRYIHGKLHCACPMTPAVIASDDPTLLQAVRAAENAPLTVDGEDSWLALLADHGFLRHPGDISNSTAAWPFHDALFHHAATSGNATSGGYGATFPFSGGGAQPPPLRDDDAARSCLEIDVHVEQPCPVLDVMAARRSTRTFDTVPLPRNSLTTLLAAALATRETVHLTNGDSLVFRPYMSGGARGELSFLLVARNCDGLSPGVYWYLADCQRLRLLDGFASVADGLIALLSNATGEDDTLPAAALLIVADYDRMAWKYEAIVYATMLRNVGAAYQALGVAAAATGVGVCALGGGWAGIAGTGLQDALGNRVIVGAMIMGLPADG
jgi:SagB-type dehydrogenase family enzyme